MGSDVELIAARLGWELLGWQRYVADVSSELTADGRWHYPVVVLTVPRQCGKSALAFSIMAQRAIQLADHRSAYAAQTGQDGRRLFREEWVPRAEMTMGKRWRIRRSNGEESLTWRATNGIIKPFPPVPGALHNSQSDMAVIDEAWKHVPELGDALLQAAVPTQTTRKRRQLWLVSTAGTAESVWMRKWVQRGRDAEPGIAHFEWGAASVDAADDEEQWPLVHPAVGELVTMADLRDFRAALGREGFARAYMNVWPELPTEAELPAGPLDVESWAQCLDASARITGRVVLAADADPMLHVGTICAAGVGPKGHHVEMIEARHGTVWLAARLAELAAKHDGLIVADEGGPIGWVAETLARDGIAYEAIKPATYARACAQLTDAVRAGQLTHPASGPLDAAVAAVERRSMGGGWCWDRRRSRGDIAPLVAATLAYAGAVHELAPEASAVF